MRIHYGHILIALFVLAGILVIFDITEFHENYDSILFEGDKTVVEIERGKEITLGIGKPSEYKNKDTVLIINDPTDIITMTQVKKDLYKIKANKEGKVKAEIHLTGFDYYMPILINVERPHNLLPVEK